MATRVDIPHSATGIVDTLGIMDISPQNLQPANDIPVAHPMIDSTTHPPSDFFIKHSAPETYCLKGSHYKPLMNPFEHRLPSEFEIDPLLFFPDALSTAHPHDMSVHRVDDLSIQLDRMAIDDTGSPIPALPDLIDNECSASFLESANPLYSTYSNFSLSPPAPSFFNFLEEAGIDIEQYAELSRRYSPDVEWEDIPLSVREYQMQEMYLAQVEDLCNEMEGIAMSPDFNESISLAPEEFDMAVVADQSNSLGLFIEATEDLGLMPLRGLICIDSFTGGGQGEEESALWAPA